MIYRGISEMSAASLPLKVVRECALSAGWVATDKSRSSNVEILENLGRSAAQIALPTSEDLTDYGRRIIDVILVLSEHQGRPPELLLRALAGGVGRDSTPNSILGLPIVDVFVLFGGIVLVAIGAAVTNALTEAYRIDSMVVPDVGKKVSWIAMSLVMLLVPVAWLVGSRQTQSRLALFFYRVGAATVVLLFALDGVAEGLSFILASKT